MGRTVISCFRQNLDFSIGFAMKMSNFTLPPILRFLCLINSFCRRYVPCKYNISNIFGISNISNISNILSHYFSLFWAIVRYCVLFRSISVYFGLFRALLCAIVRYFVLFRFIVFYFAIFRQSLVPQESAHGIHMTCLFDLAEGWWVGGWVGGETDFCQGQCYI